MIHGKPVTQVELQKEIELQKTLLEISEKSDTPIIAAVSENPNGDGDHISSLLLAGLSILANGDNKNG